MTLNTMRVLLFQTKCVTKERSYRMIIDGGSCNNLARSDMVEKLALSTKLHPHPYHIQWLNNSGKAKVMRWCALILQSDHIMMLLSAMLCLCKLVIFCSVDLGNLIRIVCIMVN
jgi:hypothetical protein